MAELKTKPTKESVADFLNAVDDDQIRKDRGGLSCVHIRRLSDLHLPTLKKLIDLSVKKLKERSRN